MSGGVGGFGGSSSNEDRPGSYRDDLRRFLPIFGMSALVIVVGLIVYALVR